MLEQALQKRQRECRRLASAGLGCAQVLFFESDEVCETSYKDRGGKYQGQVGVTLPKT